MTLSQSFEHKIKSAYNQADKAGRNILSIVIETVRRFDQAQGAEAAAGWEIITLGFTWYLGSGLVQYELVYGSLGTIVGLMFWIYLGSLITLFGAHLTATLSQQKVSSQ